MGWRIPLADIVFDRAELTAVQKVMEDGWLTMGAVTREFEEAFAQYVGARHALAVTNGTAALHLACLALGIGPGDEVIVPSLTFVATAAAVRYTGAEPVFADIVSEHELNISSQSIEGCITDKTRAIIVVHYGGYPCDMSSILECAHVHQLAVIEDAAHAPGSSLEDKKLGTWGDIGCFSFFSNKNLITGEGGMLTTDDDAIADRLHRLRSHGMTTLTWDRHRGHAWSYDVVDLGYNYRIDEIRSAIGHAQLKKLEENNQKRRNLTKLYHQRLKEIVPQVTIPFQEPRGVSSCHLLPILLPPDTNRVDFMEGMKARGIQTSVHYPPIHQFKHYRGIHSLDPDSLRLTEEIATREVTLPLYPSLDPKEVEDVVQAVEELLPNQPEGSLSSW